MAKGVATCVVTCTHRFLCLNSRQATGTINLDEILPLVSVSPQYSLNRRMRRGNDEGLLWLRVHFGIVLSGVLMFCHPWQAICALIGLANADVGRRHRNQEGSFCVS